MAPHFLLGPAVVDSTIRPTVAASAVAALLDFAAAKGADRAELMELAQIELVDIDHPDNRVPLSRYVAATRAAKSLTNDAAFALHFGEAFEIAQLSIIGLMAQACNTAEEAFARLGRFNRLVADVELEQDAGGERYVLSRTAGEVRLVDKRKNPNDFPEMTESSLARMVCTGRRLLGRPIVRQVHVTHTAPEYRDEYDRIFQVPIVFESDWNGLLMVDDTWMAQRSSVPSPYVLRVLMERAELLLQNLDSEASTRSRVERTLELRLHLPGPQMDAVSKALGISRATLLRRLREEGTTFEGLLQTVREKLARRLLTVEKASIKEAAYLCGFSDPASFSRAFKRWTGSSPSTVRDTLE